MKTIYLVRHAKSSWDLNDLPDIDRALNERGYRDAHLIGAKLEKESVKPDLMISSPANRALTTALIIARAIHYKEDKMILKRNLYETSGVDYIEVISELKDSVNSVMLFGHNPIISEAAMWLSEKVKTEMATCEVIGMKFKIHSWKEILKSKKEGEVVLNLFPKMYSEE